MDQRRERFRRRAAPRIFAWLGPRQLGERYGVEPIASLRGLPDDFVMGDDGAHPISHNAIRQISDREMHRNIDAHPGHRRYLMVSMDGSYPSWLHGDEILSARLPQDASFDASQDDIFLSFLGEVRRLRDKYGEVRVVFCFH